MNEISSGDYLAEASLGWGFSVADETGSIERSQDAPDAYDATVQGEPEEETAELREIVEEAQGASALSEPHRQLALLGGQGQTGGDGEIQRIKEKMKEKLPSWLMNAGIVSKVLIYTGELKPLAGFVYPRDVDMVRELLKLEGGVSAEWLPSSFITLLSVFRYLPAIDRIPQRRGLLAGAPISHILNKVFSPFWYLYLLYRCYRFFKNIMERIFFSAREIGESTQEERTRNDLWSLYTQRALHVNTRWFNWKRCLSLVASDKLEDRGRMQLSMLSSDICGCMPIWFDRNEGETLQQLLDRAKGVLISLSAHAYYYPQLRNPIALSTNHCWHYSGGLNLVWLVNSVAYKILISTCSVEQKLDILEAYLKVLTYFPPFSEEMEWCKEVAFRLTFNGEEVGEMNDPLEKKRINIWFQFIERFPFHQMKSLMYLELLDQCADRILSYEERNRGSIVRLFWEICDHMKKTLTITINSNTFSRMGWSENVRQFFRQLPEGEKKNRCVSRLSASDRWPRESMSVFFNTDAPQEGSLREWAEFSLDEKLNGQNAFAILKELLNQKEFFNKRLEQEDCFEKLAIEKLFNSILLECSRPDRVGSWDGIEQKCKDFFGILRKRVPRDYYVGLKDFLSTWSDQHIIPKDVVSMIEGYI